MLRGLYWMRSDKMKQTRKIGKTTLIEDDYEGLAKRVLEEVEKKHIETISIDIVRIDPVGGSGDNLSYNCRAMLQLEPYVEYAFNYSAKGSSMFTWEDSREVLHKKLRTEFKKVGLISEIKDFIQYGTAASQVCRAPGNGLMYVFKKEK